MIENPLRKEVEDRYGEIQKRVVVDGVYVNQELDLVSPWDKKTKIIGYVCENKRGNKYLVQPIIENGISDNEWPTDIGVCDYLPESKIEELPMYGRCDCGNSFVYHQKKDEWVCPFCDLK